MSSQPRCFGVRERSSRLSAASALAYFCSSSLFSGFWLNDLTRNTTDATIRPANISTILRLNIQLLLAYPHIAAD